MKAFSLLLFVLIGMSYPISAQTDHGDWLIYGGIRTDTVVRAYNPNLNIDIELTHNFEVDRMRVSGEGHIAYVYENDVWVLDFYNAPLDPVNITQAPDIPKTIIEWSPNGTYLTYRLELSDDEFHYYRYDWDESLLVGVATTRYFWRWKWNSSEWYVTSDLNNDNQVYVWNGQERIDLILPSFSDTPEWYEFHWTPNNHLFITVGFAIQEYMQPIGLTRIFYWNGDVVEEVIKPNDNSETFMLGDSHSDGRLTFYTIQSGSYFEQWYIWDGNTYTADGIPNLSTATRINDSTLDIDDVDWMSDGRLVIVAVDRDNTEINLLGETFICDNVCAAQVFVWDGQSFQSIARTEFGSFLVSTHHMGYLIVEYFNGIFITGFMVFDTSLQVLTEIGALGNSRWSEDGNLVYCDRSSLYVWNRQNSVSYSIVLNRETYSQWLFSDEWALGCSAG